MILLGGRKALKPLRQRETWGNEPTDNPLTVGRQLDKADKWEQIV